MCGICGIVGVSERREAEPLVRKMMAALTHRGPDDQGLLFHSPVTFGMRRLSIIDISGGHQPVYNEDGSIAVVFNGEIYNFPDLRRELEGLGHVFQTHSDTEVIVHAYEAWGQDCVSHFRGMFAFALLDSRRSGGSGGASVFLARDRVGIKPLYYALVNGVFVFASEVRALLASGCVARQISRAALESYLLFGSVSEPMTLVEDVFSLPPGHHLCLTVTPGRSVDFPLPQRYWSFASAAHQSPAEASTRRDEPAGRLRALLEDAVRSHLIADVPLGIFLSSGIDSTVLTALAARDRAGIHTFTVVFPEQEFSEAAVARRTAQRLGTRHEELLLSGEQMLVQLDEATGALDQPTMDGINTFFVSWAARQVGLKVALSGLGGDEVFGGYSTFRNAPHMRRVASFAHRVPRALRSATAAGVAQLGSTAGRREAGRKVAALVRDPESLPHSYFYSRTLFAPQQVTGLLPGAFSGDPSPWRAWLAAAVGEADHFDEFTAISILEARSYMVNTLLRDTDAVSMHHSLEVRVPLLDHRLVEFVTSLPGSVKADGTLPKSLLVHALRDLIPSEIVEQPKRTFTFPWEHWLRDSLRPRIASSLHDLAAPLRSFLNAAVVDAVWRDFLSGRTNWSRPWSLFVLNEWVRRHISPAGSLESREAHIQPSERVV